MLSQRLENMSRECNCYLLNISWKPQLFLHTKTANSPRSVIIKKSKIPCRLTRDYFERQLWWNFYLICVSRRTQGQLTFNSRTILPRGDFELKGVQAKQITHTYFWNQVESPLYIYHYANILIHITLLVDFGVYTGEHEVRAEKCCERTKNNVK